ncbi:hypothetical protein JCM8202_003693 [Rhodotorula sphaerocarpa]
MSPLAAPRSSSAVQYSLLPSPHRRGISHGSSAEFASDKAAGAQWSDSPRSSRHRSKASVSRVLEIAVDVGASPRWKRVGAVLVVVLGLLSLANLLRGRSPMPSIMHTDRAARVPVDFETRDVPSEWKCNPFKEAGRLHVDTENKFHNIWRPYDEDCSASQLFQGLIRNVNRTREREAASRSARSGPLRAQDATMPWSDRSAQGLQYPWLVNATVLLVGDSMERLHLNDFCDFVGGEAINVNPLHIASPAPFHKSLQPVYDSTGAETPASQQARQDRQRIEREWEEREGSWFYTRPWVCNVQEYNFTMINTFTCGMEDMEQMFQSEDFYHGPATWLERFHHITLPLLRNVANYLDRPHVLKPTLIEIASGYWDLRGWTEQDFMKAGYSRPYPKDSDIAFGPIGLLREQRWIDNARNVVKEIARTFPGAKGIRDGPPILWRSMHHVKRNNYTPYSRVAPLDALARKTMHELRVSSLATDPAFFSSLYRALPYLGKSRKANSRRDEDADDSDAEEESKVDEVDYGFDERLRIDEIGKLLEGQEHHMRDFLHPDALPGSYIWGDILLYELKRAYYRVGRSNPVA